MEKLKTVLDLALLALLLFGVNYFFQKNEPQEWVNPLKSLPFDELQEIHFPADKFKITLRSGLDPVLNTGERTYPVPLARLQKYMDNLFFLPKFEMTEAQADLKHFGLHKQAKLILKFKGKSQSIWLGDPVPGQGFLYFSIKKGSFGKIPSVYVGNVDWKAFQFLPRMPFYGFKKALFHSKDQEIQVQKIGESFQIFPEKPFLKVDPLVQKLQVLRLEAAFSKRGEFENCQLFATIDQRSLYTCDQAIHDPGLGIAWPHTRVSKEWSKDLLRFAYSGELRDYYPQILTQGVNKISFSDGSFIDRSSKTFDYRLQKLKEKSGEVRSDPLPGKAFSIEVNAGENTILIPGVLARDLKVFCAYPSPYYLCFKIGKLLI